LSKGFLYVVIAAILWSTGGIGIKAVEEPPLKVAFYRSVFAAIALFAFFRPTRPRFSKSFAIAVVSYGACLTAFVTATKWTTAANAIFLQYTGVIWILLLSPLVLKEPLRRRDLVCVVVALGGMALFFVDRIEAGNVAGNMMALVSGVFFAALILALRSARGLAAESAVTWGNLFLSLALLPFVGNDLPVTLKSGAILALLGVFQIALAYAFFVTGLRYVTATQGSLTGMLEPIMNPIWVFLFIGERPSKYAMIGAVIVLAAVAWSSLAPKTPTSEVGVPPLD
jgi:drug/metabolite transporter, DME family